MNTLSTTSKQKFSFHNRRAAFRFAFAGLCYFFRREANARLHLAATILVIALGFLFHLHFVEWLLIIGAIGLVWIAEIFNTAIELIVNFISPGRHPLAGLIKDVAAAAVLFASFTSLVIAILIFIPKCYAYVLPYFQ